MEEMAQAETAGPILESMQGSYLWQIVFLIMAAVFILTKALGGWQSGGPRQLMGLIALAAAYAAAILVGPKLASGLAPYIAGPHFLRTMIAGLLIAVVVYGVVVIVGMFSFDRAREMEEGASKRLFQITGAFLGAIYGAAIVLVVVIVINLLGTVSQAMVEGNLAGKIRETEALSQTGGLPPEEVVTEIESNKLAEWFARLRNSIRMGPGEQAVEAADPLPDYVYKMADDAIRVMADPIALERFGQHPAVQDIMQDPKIVALANDRELQLLLEDKQYISVMQHPKVAAAADDPELQRKLIQEDVADALEEALAGQREAITGAEDAGRLRYESFR